jgi:3-oxoacyl-[acyl-carrier protein] reductase
MSEIKSTEQLTHGELTGRVALVSGSARNIGRTIALELARAGASVMVNALSDKLQAQRVAQEIEDLGGRAQVHLANVANPQEVKEMVDACVASFGRLDIVVNNAALRRHAKFEELGWEQWREVMGVILDGSYLCAHASLEHLKKSDMASIINLGGLSAHTGSKERAHVIAAKTGLIGLTRALACDLSQYNINVNCVVPGLIDTDRGESAGKGTPEHHAKNKTLSGQKGTPQDVANLVQFLCGPKARYITGQTLHANGGAFLG